MKDGKLRRVSTLENDDEQNGDSVNHKHAGAYIDSLQDVSPRISSVSVFVVPSVAIAIWLCAEKT